MMNIALFGTSADPPTAGHQRVLNWLSQRFDWVAVWASDNPFKQHQTPLEHRAAMLRLMIADIHPLRHNIGYYPDLSSPRALVTVQHAKKWWPESNLFLVIGSDLVAQLPRWYRIDELLAQVQLLVMPRPGYPLNQEAIARLREMGARIAIAQVSDLPDVSSTAYREVGDSTVLTPPIEDYIHREQLYECQNGAPKSLPAR